MSISVVYCGRPASGWAAIRPALLAALLIAVLPGQVSASDKPFYVSVWAEYVTGRYGGDESLDDVYFPLSIGYRGRKAAVSLTVPYVRFTTPLTDGVTTVGYATRGGLGDVSVALTLYDVWAPANGDWLVDVTGTVKFGTADEDKGLGTGENDYVLQTDFYRFYARSTWLATIGYKQQGDTEAVQFEDVWFTIVGAAYHQSPESSVALLYSYRPSSFAEGYPLQEVTGYYTRRIDSSWYAQRIGRNGRSQSRLWFGDRRYR